MDPHRRHVVLARLERLSTQMQGMTDTFFQKFAAEIPNVASGEKDVNQAVSNAVAPTYTGAVAVMTLEMAAQDVVWQAQAEARKPLPNIEYIDGCCYAVERILYYRQEVKKEAAQ